MDISGLSLQGIDLSHRDLSFAIAWGTDFCGCKMNGTHIEYLDIDEHTKFDDTVRPAISPVKFWSAEGAALRNLHKPTKTLQDMLDQHKIWLDTKGQQGKRLDVSGMKLSDTDFSGTDLRFIIASNTGFQRCRFDNANLGGANLRFAKMFYSHLNNTVLVGADLYASFSRWVNFTNAIMRESDVRNFHDQLMGTNKTTSHTIALVSTTVSVASVAPAALQVLPIEAAFAPIVVGAIWTALSYRQVLEFAMGGWYFRPIKNTKEVLFNVESDMIQAFEKNLAECIDGNPILMSEHHSIKNIEQFKLQQKIDAEIILNKFSKRQEKKQTQNDKISNILTNAKISETSSVNDANMEIQSNEEMQRNM